MRSVGKKHRMVKKLSERHHWWPECVSQHWADADGVVHRLSPDGEVRSAPPKNFGVIGNGHLIKLSYDPEFEDVRFENFEREFQRADDRFPGVLRWLDDLDRKGPPFEASIEERMLTQQVTDIQFSDLIECIVSLAVRSPRHREQAVALAERFRGPLPERERNVLIGVNMRHSLRSAVQSISGRGKIAVLYSAEKEFIFGDGFFHNIIAPVQHVTHAKLCVPLTPWLAILFARPSSFRIEPRLVTIAVGPDEADAINHSVRVYSRNQLFYRSERPEIDDVFLRRDHCEYSDDRNPIDSLIYRLPGISPRHRTYDFFRDNYGV